MKVPENIKDITLEWFNTIFSPHSIQVHEFSFGGEMSNGRGMMGSLEEVKLEISRPPSDTREQLDIVLKTLPRDEFRKSYAANDGFCSREVSVYTDIFKAWDEFLDSRQVPMEARLRHPICYYGAEEGHKDTYKYILVLENLLAKKGEDKQFYLWDAGFFEALPWSAASSVIREIARFHATGIAYKLEHKVQYAKQFPHLNHVISPYFEMMWNGGFEETKNVIKSTLNNNEIPEGLFEQMDRMKGEAGKTLLLKWFTDPTVFQGQDQATVCHHDLHSNNLVLTKDHSKAILFDLQACCVFNPMKDLSFFLVLNCETDLAITNISKALKFYHDEFEKTMKAINSDFTYSLENITKDYEQFLAFSLTHVMTGAQFWISGKGSTVESKRRFSMAVVDAYKRGVLTFPETN